jgi:hypothetical protein
MKSVNWNVMLLLVIEVGISERFVGIFFGSLMNVYGHGQDRWSLIVFLLYNETRFPSQNLREEEDSLVVAGCRIAGRLARTT